MRVSLDCGLGGSTRWQLSPVVCQKPKCLHKNIEVVEGTAHIFECFHMEKENEAALGRVYNLGAVKDVASPLQCEVVGSPSECCIGM